MKFTSLLFILLSFQTIGILSQTSVQTELNFNFARLVPKVTKLPPPPADTTQIFTLVALVDVTGKLNSDGPNVLQGYRAAVAEWNSFAKQTGSGVLVYLYVVDTQSDPTKALAGMMAWSAKGARVFLGPQTSAEVEAVKPFSDANNLVIISTTSTAQTLEVIDNIFRLAPSDSSQSRAIATYLFNQGISGIIPVYRDDTFGRGFSALVTQHFNAFGGFATAGVAYNDSTTAATVAAALSRIATASAANRNFAVVLASFSEWAAIVAAATRFPSLATLTFIGPALDTSVVIPPEVYAFAAQASLVSLNFFLPTSDLKVKVRDTLVARGVQNPTDSTYLAYDSAYLAILTYNYQRKDDFPSFRDNLMYWSSTQFLTSGRLGFDQVGDRTGLYFAFDTLRGSAWSRTAVYNSDASISQ